MPFAQRILLARVRLADLRILVARGRRPTTAQYIHALQPIAVVISLSDLYWACLCVSTSEALRRLSAIVDCTVASLGDR